MKSKLFIQSFIASMLLTCSPLGFAQTYIVKSNADTDGATCGSDCTLRQAINAANANAGADSIEFELAPGQTTIILASSLPDITETLKINGANDDSDSDSSDSSDGIDRVVLDGSTPCARMLFFAGSNASNSKVKNLQLNNSCVAIRLEGTETEQIEDVKVINNIMRGGGAGIETEWDKGTMIAHNDCDGASEFVDSLNSKYTIIDNNITKNISNSDIVIFSGENFTITNNTMVDGRLGVFGCGVTNTKINHNTFTNYQRQVIESLGFSDGEIIGNTTIGGQTTIATPEVYGLILLGPRSQLFCPADDPVDNEGNILDVFGVNRNIIKDNTIIVDPAVTNDRLISGITVFYTALTPIVRNANDNLIKNNTIVGTDTGVLIGQDPRDVFFGFIPTGCSFNTDPTLCRAIGNTVIENKIKSTGVVGIELTESWGQFPSSLALFSPNLDGINPNDVDDLDDGPNNKQNYPENLVATLLDDDEFRLTGDLDTRSGSYRIDVYLSDAANRQAQIPVGHFMVTTDSDGNASFDREIDVDDDQSPDDIDLNELYVTTTATEVRVVDNNDDEDSSSDDSDNSDSSSDSSDDDYSNLGSTSELSEAVEIN